MQQFPIVALVHTIRQFLGSNVVRESPFRVIWRSVELMYFSDSLVTSDGVSQRISPFQLLLSRVDGVPPEWIIPTFANFTCRHSGLSCWSLMSVFSSHLNRFSFASISASIFSMAVSHFSSKDAMAFCSGNVGKEILKLAKSFAFAPGCAERALIFSI